LPNQSHTTGKAHREIRWLIIVPIMWLATALLILGVHLGRQGLQIGGITVIPKPSVRNGLDAAKKQAGLPTRTGMSVPEIYGPYRGVVDLAHDGDTVNIRLDLGFDITVYSRVRVKGINAPELSTDAGKRARDFAQSVLPPGTEVYVSSYGWDKYGGRIDGVISFAKASYAYQGKLYSDFAQLMLDSGNAVAYNP
jgi:endonuclease YncB( thermonuclease family)